MEIKDPGSFEKHLSRMPLETPEIIVISGSDTGVLDTAALMIKARLQREIGAFETTVYSAEPGEDSRFRQEVFNIPLFAPYRFFIVRHGEELFAPYLPGAENSSRKSESAALKREFERLPDRTLILIEFSGNPPAKFLDLFAGKLCHLQTKELYSNQVLDVVRATAKKLGIQLEDESIYEIRDRVPQKAAAIESALQRLRGIVKDRAVSVEDVREILFPAPGVQPFALVDAIFAQDHTMVEKELLRFNPQEDNFLVILKLILNRANEIRQFLTGRKLGMSESEILEFLDIKNRPPFIQKKILSRLADESRHFNNKRLSILYAFLVKTGNEFRSGVPAHKQNLFFQEKIMEVFFS